MFLCMQVSKYIYLPETLSVSVKIPYYESVHSAVHIIHILNRLMKVIPICIDDKINNMLLMISRLNAMPSLIKYLRVSR